MRLSKTIADQEKPFRGKLLTVKEAADYVRLGKSSMYNLIAKGTIRSFNPDHNGQGKKLVDSAALDDWLRIREIG